MRVARRYYSFLALFWGIIADLDIESEKWRCCGNARFTFQGVVRALALRKYTGKILYLPASAPLATPNAESKESHAASDDAPASEVVSAADVVIGVSPPAGPPLRFVDPLNPEGPLPGASHWKVWRWTCNCTLGACAVLLTVLFAGGRGRFQAVCSCKHSHGQLRFSPGAPCPVGRRSIACDIQSRHGSIARNANLAAA